ncbi:MAG: hypothetical protein KAX46_01365 [Chromatiaceae bacterium]|nr:hypothetical protein [Chromatiaceae bacterium]
MSTSTALAPVASLQPASVSLGVLSASSPAALVDGASQMATELAQVIRTQNLSTVIQGRHYVQVEGWTTLGVMLGVTAREVSTVEDPDREGVYISTVELVRMSDGAIVSRASAECGDPDELDRYKKPLWASRPRYARRSMAQTRATGKACRLAFSWIMRLAGYEATPAEEMPQPELPAATTAPDPKPAPRREAPPPQTNGAPISAKQHTMLEARITELALDRERVKSWVARAWGVEHLDQVPAARFNELLNRLGAWHQAAQPTPTPAAQAEFADTVDPEWFAS